MPGPCCCKPGVCPPPTTLTLSVSGATACCVVGLIAYPFKYNTASFSGSFAMSWIGDFFGFRSWVSSTFDYTITYYDAGATDCTGHVDHTYTFHDGQFEIDCSISPCDPSVCASLSAYDLTTGGEIMDCFTDGPFYPSIAYTMGDFIPNFWDICYNPYPYTGTYNLGSGGGCTITW
jgi:hypothetical protein